MRNPFITAIIFAFICTSAVANVEKGVADFDKGVAAYAENNIPQAFKEFNVAAELGHDGAQFNVGLMYEQGLGTDKNEEKALTWYIKSGNLGNMFAQYNVGVFYENGKGTKVDFTKAHTWYRKAVMQSDGLAVGNLGMLYIRGDGVAENKEAGLALLILSTTLDGSPQNIAKSNISKTRGLTPAMVTTAQALSSDMISTKTPLMVLDNFLAKTSTK